MSAIGNYIHYSKKNYREWGINRKGTTPSSSWSEEVNYLKARLDVMNKVNSLTQQAKMFEDQYNKICYPQKEADGLVNEFKNILKTSIVKNIENDITDSLSRIDTSSIPLEGKELLEILNLEISITKENLENAKINKDKAIENLLKLTKKMYNLLKVNTFKNSNKIDKKISDITAQLKIIERTLQKDINESGGKTVNISNISKDLETIMKIIQDFNKTPFIYYSNEDITNWIPSFVSTRISSQAKEELFKSLKSIDKKDSLTIFQEKLQKDINLLAPDINIETNDIKMSTTTRKNKNILIKIKQVGKNKIIRKRIAGKRNLRILSVELMNDKSLQQIINLANANNFVNHYLNIVANATGEYALNRNILQANRLMQGLILNLGIDNFESNSKNIEFIVINDTLNKKFKVYDIKALLYLIQDKIINGNENKYSNIVSLRDDFTIEQKFDEKSAGNRIKKILLATEKVKISTKLDSNLLNSYLSLLY